MEFNMGYCQVECPGFRLPPMINDLLIMKHVEDLRPQNLTRPIKNKSKIKDIETSIFLERILNIFNKLLKKIELLLVNSGDEETSDECKFFLQQIEIFMEHVITRIKNISEEEKTMYYGKMWHAIKKAHIDIKDLSALIHTQSLRYQKKLNSVLHQRAKRRKKMKKSKRKYENEIKHTVLQSEKNQLKAYKTSIINRKNLMQAEKEAKNNLQNLCNQNSLAEKELSSQRYKMETELTSIISKYDTEAEEKDKELNDLTEEFRSIDSELYNLQKNMEPQLDIYIGLIYEKEELMLKTFKENLEKFVVLRSTKIIQRWWRQIYWRWRIKSARSQKDEEIEETQIT